MVPWSWSLIASVIHRVDCAAESQMPHPEGPSAGLGDFASLHVPRWCQCWWSGDHTLRTTTLQGWRVAEDLLTIFSFIFPLLFSLTCLISARLCGQRSKGKLRTLHTILLCTTISRTHTHISGIVLELTWRAEGPAGWSDLECTPACNWTPRTDPEWRTLHVYCFREMIL